MLRPELEEGYRTDVESHRGTPALHNLSGHLLNPYRHCLEASDDTALVSWGLCGQNCKRGRRRGMEGPAAALSELVLMGYLLEGTGLSPPTSLVPSC